MRRSRGLAVHKWNADDLRDPDGKLPHTLSRTLRSTRPAKRGGNILVDEWDENEK